MTSSQNPPSCISVIIPSLDEAANLPRTLGALRNHHHTEIIVVDGGSSDDSLAVSKGFGATVLESEQERAQQMNLGAGHAYGEVFLFLHAETILPETWPNEVRAALAHTNVCGGAFSLGIQGDSFKLRLIEKLAQFRSHRFALPYGDQAIFVRSEIFRDMGGFPDLPIMEDFEFMRHLRKRGLVRILPERVVTSGRRWHQLGVLRTTVINQAIVLGYYLGVPPEKLASFYRRKR